MANTNKKAPMPPTLYILAGAYLLYTAWQLRTSLAERPLFLIAIIFFVLAGAALIAFAAWRMHQAQHTPPETPEEEETQEEITK